MVWVLLSFFAVLGLLNCVINVLELFALRRIKSVRRAVFRVELAGEEDAMEYLLNSLSIVAQRAELGAVEAELEVVDAGLSESARCALESYCQKNPWVIFTDKE
ncbi:MAG: hypothetical protein IJN82_00580 [Clostridia bacterium]|nr:hypothetical protein [Clostridia bacterium]